MTMGEDGSGRLRGKFTEDEELKVLRGQGGRWIT